MDNNDFNRLAEELAAGFLHTTALLGNVVASLEHWHEGSHSSFVAHKAGAMARLLGMNAAEIVEIETAGLLHDIGKVGLPDAIAAKVQAELTDEEFRIYAAHPEHGRRILSAHPHFDTIGEIIAQHHERYDGAGFPAKLRGGQIHRGATLIAVADYYHNAMHRKHPGRSGQSFIPGSGEQYLRATQSRFANVMNALHSRSGRWFPADAVEAFTSIIESERRALGIRTVMRLAANQLKPGLMFAEDYYASYGLLLAARGEPVTEGNLPRIMQLAETGELPQKILVMH